MVLGRPEKRIHMDRRKTDRRTNGSGDLYVFDVPAVLAILWRRRLWVVVIFLGLLIPGLLYVALKPNFYRATTSVIIEDQELNLADFKDALPSGKFDEMTIETQAKVIASPKIVHRTLDALERTEKPAMTTGEARYNKVRDFLRSLSVMPIIKSRIIEISYTAHDPIQAARIVNVHAQQYSEYQAESEREKLRLLNNWLSAQIEILKKSTQDRAQKMQEFRGESGILLGKNSQDLIYDQISDLTEELVPIETKKLNLQARAEALASSPSQDVDADIISSGLIANLKTQLSSAKQELKSLSPNLGKNHPEYLAAKKRVDQASADLSAEIETVKNSTKAELDAAIKQEELIHKRLEELNRQADEFREKQVQIESMESEETANKTLLENFLTRAEEIKSQMEYDHAAVHIVSPAEPPTEPIGTRKSLLFMVLAMFAGVFAVGGGLLLELIDRGIEDEDDIKRLLNLKLLGILPNKASSAHFEELKRIYLALSARKEPQVLLLTSARRGEGVSEAALSLAKYTASIHQKTILIDVSGSHLQTPPGLAEILAGKSTLDKTLHDDKNGYTVLPAGDQNKYPMNFMASDIFPNLLQILKESYNFIIIDARPVLKTTDTEIIAGLADQVILIIEWARTKKKELKKVSLALRQHTKDTPNAILNKRA